MFNGDPVPNLNGDLVLGNDDASKKKTSAQLTNRWIKVLKPTVNNFPRRVGKWTDEEDKLLTEALRREQLNKNGENALNVRVAWSKISTSVPGNYTMKYPQSLLMLTLTIRSPWKTMQRTLDQLLKS